MSLKIITIVGKGNLHREHVLIKVVKDCNLVNFEIWDTTYEPSGKISNKNRHVEKLPCINAKSGEFIRLFTKRGQNDTKSIDGLTYHDVYCGMHKTIWNKNGDCPSLEIRPLEMDQLIKELADLLSKLISAIKHRQKKQSVGI